MAGSTPETRWGERLRAGGLRVTRVRLAVLGHLERTGAPQAAAEVVDGVGRGGGRRGGAAFDRVTIYRTLHSLVDAGLATRSDPGDRIWRFALAEGEHESHAHLVCDACGSVTCVDEATVSASPRQGAKKRRFKLEARGATLHGTCEECLGS